MSFPETKFGICTRCGGDGRDQTADLTGADAAAGSGSANGVELEEYDGKMLCPVCITQLKSEAKSLTDSQKHAEEEKFRGQAGFDTSVR